MPVTVTLNLPDFQQPFLDAATMRDVGDLAIRMIRTRTEAGKDVTGAAFAPYTPGYAERRAKEGLGITPNLTVSGRMLNDMGVVAVAPGSVSIGFRSSGGGPVRGKGLTLIQRSRALGAEDKARFHDVLGAGASRTVRKFLGLTPQETETIRDRVRRHLDDLARRLSR